MNESNGKPASKSVIRNPNGIGGFKKGQSGNPKGRPKLEDDMKAMIREFMAERDPAVRRMRLRDVFMRLYKEKPEILLYLGWGKPTESHTITVREEIAGVPQDIVEALRTEFRNTISSN